MFNFKRLLPLSILTGIAVQPSFADINITINESLPSVRVSPKFPVRGPANFSPEHSPVACPVGPEGMVHPPSGIPFPAVHPGHAGGVPSMPGQPGFDQFAPPMTGPALSPMMHMPFGPGIPPEITLRGLLNHPGLRLKNITFEVGFPEGFVAPPLPMAPAVCP